MRDRPQFKNLKQPIKGFEVYYDKVSERYVFEIYDTDGMLPLLIKTPTTRVYEIVQTRTGKLNMR